MAQVANHVVSIDPHQGDGIGMPTLDGFLINIEQHHLVDKITVIVGESQSYQYYGDQFDLVFIDGKHTYDQVTIDANLADIVLRPGGIIAFHDYDFQYPNVPVTKAVDKFLKDYPYKKIDEVGSLLVVQKNAD